MKPCPSLMCLLMAGVFCVPAYLHGEVVEPHRFELVLSGERFTLRGPEDLAVPIPREWLVPARDREEEQSSYVSSFDYDEAVTAFPVTKKLVGIHLSSYQIQKEGSARAAAGRDVFLVLDPETQALSPGRLDLGVTKARIRFMGCFGAHHSSFVVEDIDGDLQNDIGVKRDEVACESAYDEKEDVDYFVSKDVTHPWRWYLFEADRWVHSAVHEGRAPTARAFELPLIEMVKSPVAFVREMSSRNDR